MVAFYFWGENPSPNPPEEGAILKDTLAVYARYAQGASAALPSFSARGAKEIGDISTLLGQNIPTHLVC